MYTYTWTSLCKNKNEPTIGNLCNIILAFLVINVSWVSIFTFLLYVDPFKSNFKCILILEVRRLFMTISLMFF